MRFCMVLSELFLLSSLIALRFLGDCLTFHHLESEGVTKALFHFPGQARVLNEPVS